jgi:hypothetical protein
VRIAKSVSPHFKKPLEYGTFFGVAEIVGGKQSLQPFSQS